MDREIVTIINRALDGAQLTPQEVKALFLVEEMTEEAFAIRRAGRIAASEPIRGKAEIHGQIGINTGRCPKDCQFCSFAASNGVFGEASTLTIDETVEGVLSMERQGANAIYVMSTANFKFDTYLEYSAAIKAALKPETTLVANTGDFNATQAEELKAVGYDAVYHAIRMGEGVHTKIPLERRIATIEAAKAAGLAVGMCVEPVGPEHEVDELVEKTLLTRDLGACFSGAMRRTTIPTSPFAQYGQTTYARMATIVSIVALATGPKVPGNCTHEPNALGVYAGANVVWAEVGSNPRDTEAETVRGWTVDRCRDLYHECGWDVLDGRSVIFDS